MNKERPILFSGEMVRAILNGSKTQTRRIVKPQPTKGYVMFMPLSGEIVGVTKHGGPIDNRGWLHCPYGKPGDRLWVRETYKQCGWDKGGKLQQVQYIADSAVSDWLETGLNSYDASFRVHPSIHMPRWASRINLEVESVRVERLQDITRDDARAEGCRIPVTASETIFYIPGNEMVSQYAMLWESINGPGSWNENPWVWVINFKHLK